MEQNRPEPRRTLPPAQRRRRHRIRLVRNWTVFLLSCGAMMAVMTGGILWLLPKAYALIAPPTVFEAREYTGGAETDLSDARLVLVNGNLPLTEEPTPELAVADEATGVSLEAEAAAAYRQMVEAARQDGIELVLTAGYQDAAARQSAITRICELQRQNEELNAQLELPNRTRDGEEFELLANCFGPEDVGTAMSSGASGVGLLRSSYMMLPGHAMDEQEQYLFYTSCLAAAKGKMVTVRTFDFGADRTMADAYQGVQSSKLGLRGIRSSLRNLPQMAVQICALMRAAAKGPLRVMFPMVTDIEDWDSAMQVVDHCRRKLAERGEEFEPDVPFGVMLSIPAACLTAEDFTAHGCRFFVIGTNDLTQYTHAVSRELAIAEHYYRPASPAMKKLIAMVVDAAKKADIPVTICGLAVGNAVNATQYLRLGLRSFSMSPQNLLAIKKALRDAETR